MKDQLAAEVVYCVQWLLYWAYNSWRRGHLDSALGGFLTDELRSLIINHDNLMICVNVRIELNCCTNIARTNHLNRNKNTSLYHLYFDFDYNIHLIFVTI